MPEIEGLAVEHRFIDAGESVLQVAFAGGERENGDGTPIPVLLVHGWPQHWYQWRLVLPALAAGRRVIAPDLHGFGWSEIAWERLAPTDHAADLLALLDAEGVAQVHVVGHDDGGWIGARLALAAPERVASLTLVNSTAPWAGRRLAQAWWAWRYRIFIATPWLGKWLCRLHLAACEEMNPSVRIPVIGKTIGTDRVPGYIDWLLKRGARRRENLGAEERDRYALEQRAWTRIRASVALQRAMLSDLFRFWLRPARRPAGAVPVHVVLGERDRRIPAGATPGLRSGGADEVSTVTGAGHYLPEETPDELAALILGFIDRSEAGGAAPAAAASQPLHATDA